MEILNYKELVSSFQARLLTQLRKHVADAEYLEMWVPDEDPITSILNMVEAAQAYGREELAVFVETDVLSSNQIPALAARVGRAGFSACRVAGARADSTTRAAGPPGTLPGPVGHLHGYRRRPHPAGWPGADGSLRLDAPLGFAGRLLRARFSSERGLEYRNSYLGPLLDTEPAHLGRAVHRPYFRHRQA